MFEVGDEIDLEDPFADIAPVAGVKGQHSAAHKAIRGHQCTKEFRAAVLHEVDAGRLSEIQAAQCVRGFFALQRWCLRQAGYGLGQFKNVSFDVTLELSKLELSCLSLTTIVFRLMYTAHAQIAQAPKRPLYLRRHPRLLLDEAALLRLDRSWEERGRKISSESEQRDP